MRKPLVWGGIALAMVVGVVVGWRQWTTITSSRASPSPSVSATPFTIRFPPFSPASSASIPPHFPREFILGDSDHIPTVVSGTSQIVSSHETEMHLVYTVNLSIPDLFHRYTVFTTSGLWQLSAETVGPSAGGLTLKTAVRSLSAAFSATSSSVTTVTITYRAPTFQ